MRNTIMIVFNIIKYDTKKMEEENMAKVASTREIIEKLEAYEKIHGVGAVVGIATVLNGDRTVAYKLEIANDSDFNRIFNNDGSYKETMIEISAIEDDELFERK